MDIAKIILQLQGEREQLNHVIAVLEHLSNHSGRRRGRPARWLAEAPNKQHESESLVIRAN